MRKRISENIKAFHISVFLCDILSSALQHLSKREWELWFYPIETLIMPIEFIFSENPSEVIFSLLRQRCAIPFKMHLYLPFKVISREENNSPPETVKERGRGETGARDWFLEYRAQGKTWLLMLYWVVQSQIAGQQEWGRREMGQRKLACRFKVLCYPTSHSLWRLIAGCLWL